eukprot:scaffold5039_cov50-Phaeocystis_antarctica.AAC.3
MGRLSSSSLASSSRCCSVTTRLGGDGAGGDGAGPGAVRARVRVRAMGEALLSLHLAQGRARRLGRLRARPAPLRASGASARRPRRSTLGAARAGTTPG